MSPEKQLIAIAEFCGWRKRDHDWARWLNDKEQEILFSGLPDYLNDLNAMHEADPEGIASEELCKLLEITSWTNPTLIVKEVLKEIAKRWPEALLRTIGKWKE